MDQENKAQQPVTEPTVEDDVFAHPERGLLSTNPGVVQYSNVPSVNPKKKRKGFKAALIAFGAILLLSGGAIATYVGVILPNQPDNIIAIAASKLLSADELGVDTSTRFTIEDTTDLGSSSAEFTLDASVDSSSDTSRLYAGVRDIDFNVEGLNSSEELSAVDLNLELLFKSDGKDLFFKVGGLDSVADLFGGFFGFYSDESVDEVIKVIDSRWIIQTAPDDTEAQVEDSQIDALADCVNTADQELDFEKIFADSYLESRFFEVKNQLDDEDINGESMMHFEMTFIAEKFRNFANSVIDVAEQNEQVKVCLDDYSEDFREELLGAFDVASDYDFDVWIDGDKNLRRVGVVIEQETNKITITTDLTIRDFRNVGFPEDAVTGEQIEKELEAIDLQGDASPFLIDPDIATGVEYGSDESVRSSLDYVASQLVSYTANNNGVSPSSLNDETWYDFQDNYISFDKRPEDFLYFIDGDLEFTGDVNYQKGGVCTQEQTIVAGAVAEGFALRVLLPGGDFYCISDNFEASIGSQAT